MTDRQIFTFCLDKFVGQNNQFICLYLPSGWSFPKSVLYSNLAAIQKDSVFWMDKVLILFKEIHLPNITFLMQI